MANPINDPRGQGSPNPQSQQNQENRDNAQANKQQGDDNVGKPNTPGSSSSTSGAASNPTRGGTSGQNAEAGRQTQKKDDRSQMQSGSNRTGMPAPNASQSVTKERK